MGLEWDVIEPWRLRGRLQWRRLWSCRRDGAIVRGKIYSFGDTFGAGPQNVDAVILVVVRGGSEIPTIDTVRGPGATVSG